MQYDLLIIIVLLLASAFFSGTETAMFSLNSAKISRIAEGKNPKVARLKKLLSDPEMILSSLLLGNLIVNILFSHALHEFLTESLPSIDSHLVILVIITFTMLVFADMLPKVFGLRFNETWSIHSSLPLFFWNKLTMFLSWPLNAITQKLTFWIPEIRHKYSEMELLDTLKFARLDGIIGESEHKSLQRSIHFYHDTAYSIMIPKSRVTMVPSSMPFSRVSNLFSKKKISLALVFHEKNNQILGCLNARSIIQWKKNRKKLITDFMQPVIFLPKTMLLNDVFEELIKNQLEVAAIIDEMGEFSGIVAMKEIFQTLLGNSDHDHFLNSKSVMIDIYPISQGKYRVSGSVTLHEFNDYFQTDIVSGSSETISGFLIEKMDGFPKKNTIFHFKNMTFYNMKLKNNTILDITLDIQNEQ